MLNLNLYVPTPLPLTREPLFCATLTHLCNLGYLPLKPPFIVQSLYLILNYGCN